MPFPSVIRKGRFAHVWRAVNPSWRSPCITCLQVYWPCFDGRSLSPIFLGPGTCKPWHLKSLLRNPIHALISDMPNRPTVNGRKKFETLILMEARVIEDDENRTPPRRVPVWPRPKETESTSCPSRRWWKRTPPRRLSVWPSPKQQKAPVEENMLVTPSGRGVARIDPSKTQLLIKSFRSSWFVGFFPRSSSTHIHVLSNLQYVYKCNELFVIINRL